MDIFAVPEMDFMKITTAPLSTLPEFDVREAFSKVMNIWKDRCHTVNRRLSGVVLLDEQDSKYSHILTVTNLSSENVEIHKFIPRSPDIFSTCAYEVSFWLDLFCF
ncbi:unnamed protein product [Onchocerca flexuosa]|uniref:Ras-associating domain-containing protein n=1 Tax=Onchocerca flexuosa TaxID=387005 RepID=A0A183HNY4_9BILA|nr:unnamed protein product [Onchocerca flexuosa]